MEMELSILPEALLQRSFYWTDINSISVSVYDKQEPWNCAILLSSIFYLFLWALIMDQRNRCKIGATTVLYD